MYDEQFSFQLRTSLSPSSFSPLSLSSFFSFFFRAATLVSLIERAKAGSSCVMTKKSHRDCSTIIMRDVQKRRKTGKERERETERDVGSFFFASSSNGNALFRMPSFFSFSSQFFLPSPFPSVSPFLSSLVLSLSLAHSFSLVHSRGFPERDN